MHFIAKKNLGKKQTVYFFCILQNRTNQKRFLKTHSLLEIAYENIKARCDSSHKIQHGLLIYDIRISANCSKTAVTSLILFYVFLLFSASHTLS